MEKITKLKKLLKKSKIDGYLVPKNDEFFGEYVQEDKDNLKFISNFSGSFGYALVTKKKNFLFVDGRYTTQAQIQSGKNFLIKTIPRSFPHKIKELSKYKIGFDPKLHTQTSLNHFFKKKITLLPIKENLIDKIKPTQKKISPKKYFILSKKNVGQNVKSKISLVKKYLRLKKIDLMFVSAPENVSWTLNIRGFDSKFSPLTNSYLLIDNEKNLFFFADLRKIDKKFKKKYNFLKIIDIKLLDDFFKNINNKKIEIDNKTCSLYFQNILKENNFILEKSNLIYRLKAIKNNTEIKNTFKSHLLDGVALTKFLIWVKKNYFRKKITEISAQKKLYSFRKENKSFKFSSFPTISGSGPNGAIIHYRATSLSNRSLKKGDIYLVDSGGQYSFGTTDVTRTISLNNKNNRIKNIYTRVLKGHIAVALFKLKKNSIGSDIDRVARKPLKQIKLDYPHGTGHGVGYFLNVHEGPQAFSKYNNEILKKGMIISNEPGYYEKNKFGIRIENLITVQKKKSTFYFKNLTMVPLDKNLINKKLLIKKEIDWVNKYHARIYSKFKKFMKKDEIGHFKEMCSNL